MKKYIVPEMQVYKVSCVSNLMNSSPGIGGNAGVSLGDPNSEDAPEISASGQVKEFNRWGIGW